MKGIFHKDSPAYRVAWMWLPLHIFAVVGMALFNSTVLVAFLLGYILISGYGIAVGYHRYYSHKSFKTNKVFQTLITYFGALACQGKPLYWVSVHRMFHHPFADTEKDPHSPVHGNWSAFIGWMFKIDPEKARLKGVSDMVKDKIPVFFHRHYYTTLWITWTLLFIINPYVLLGIALAQLWAFHQENVIDLFCHKRGWWGYRNYSTNDDSLNILPLGYLTWGQAWHNNHHAQAGTVSFARKWWEIDPAVFLVWLIRKRN